MAQIPLPEYRQLPHGIEPPRRAIPAEVFELFPILGSMLQRCGGDLSDGQQDAVVLLAHLEPAIRNTAEGAARSNLDAPGTPALMPTS